MNVPFSFPRAHRPLVHAPNVTSARLRNWDDANQRQTRHGAGATYVVLVALEQNVPSEKCNEQNVKCQFDVVTADDVRNRQRHCFSSWFDRVVAMYTRLYLECICVCTSETGYKIAFDLYVEL